MGSRTTETKMQARNAVIAAARERNKQAEKAVGDLAAALVTLDTARGAARDALAHASRFWEPAQLSDLLGELSAELDQLGTSARRKGQAA